jgi:hypothetical protein
MVCIRCLLFWRTVSGQRHSALHMRRDRAQVSIAIRFAARKRNVCANRERAMGLIQFGSRVSTRRSRGRIPPAADVLRPCSRSRRPGDGNPVGQLVWPPRRPIARGLGWAIASRLREFIEELKTTTLREARSIGRREIQTLALMSASIWQLTIARPVAAKRRARIIHYSGGRNS